MDTDLDQPEQSSEGHPCRLARDSSPDSPPHASSLHLVHVGHKSGDEIVQPRMSRLGANHRPTSSQRSATHPCPAPHPSEAPSWLGSPNPGFAEPPLVPIELSWPNRSTVHLAAPIGHAMVYIDKVESQRPFICRRRSGSSPTSLNGSWQGLSVRPASREREAFVANLTLERCIERTLVTRQDLLEDWSNAPVNTLR